MELVSYPDTRADPEGRQLPLTHLTVPRAASCLRRVHMPQAALLAANVLALADAAPFLHHLALRCTAQSLKLLEAAMCHVRPVVVSKQKRRHSRGKTKKKKRRKGAEEENEESNAAVECSALACFRRLRSVHRSGAVESTLLVCWPHAPFDAGH